VWEGGGLCGGVTYLVSRAALDLLRTGGQTAEDFKREYLAASKSPGSTSDLFSSCLFYKRGIPQSVEDPLIGRMVEYSPGLQFVRYSRNQTTGTIPLAMHMNLPKENVPRAIKMLHDAWMDMDPPELREA